MSRMEPSRVWRLTLIGLLAGAFSGLFGIGGGIVIVPLLVLLGSFDQRRASGTSLTAILPTAVAGTIGYALRGEVDWPVAACLAVGAVVGSMLGAWLLQRIPQQVLRWLFIAFLMAVAVRMLFLVPDRGAEFDHGLAPMLGLVAMGVIVGVLSGLLGVGGGIIVVPFLMLVFGMGDLVAKGTSLAMMIPTSISGTIANVRRSNSDVPAALVLGTLAVPASFAGVAVATVIPAQLSVWLFAALMVVTAAQLALRAWRARS